MTPYLIFLFAGFSSIVIQTLFVREMLVIFQGNELSIGIILSQWLLGTAAGNFAAARVTAKSYANIDKGNPLLAVSYIVSAAILFIVFFLARDLRTLLGIFPGEGVSLKTTYFSSLLFLAPLGAVTGAQFTLAFSHIGKAYPAASGYLFESAGYFAGGIIFTYLVLPFFSPSAVIMFLSALLFVAGALAFSKPGLKRFLLVLAALMALTLPWASKYFENLTLSRLYPGFTVKRAVYSPYAQLVSAERNGETYIFSNGVPLLTLPNPDTERTEKFAHLPLLFVRKPENILLIGGTAKFVQPLLGRDALSIDYAEPDPDLLGTLRALWPGNFSDARLKPHMTDGRQFLKNSKALYDAILIGVPYPLSLPLNRYYTLEFLELARKRLSKGGILALSLPGSLVYVSSAMAELNAVVKKTVEKVFPYSIIIPGDENIIIASSSPLSEKATLKYRFRKSRAKTLFLSEKFIDYSLDYQRRKWLNDEIDKHRSSAPVNRDYYPEAMTAGLIWWQSLFAPNTAAIYAFIARFFWLLFLLPTLWFLSGRSAGVKSTSFSSGFCAMGLQMISIWGLQVSCGNIYQLIGLLGAVFMAGTAAGAALTTSSKFKSTKVQNLVSRNPILATELLFCAWILVWLIVFIFAPGGLVTFLALSTGTGLILGYQYPVLVQKAADNQAAGIVYSYDLFGGWLAAILVGTLLIPAGGFLPTMLFLLMVKAASSYWWNRNSL